MTLVVNLYGGPGSGKSTTMAGVFYKLKLDGYNVEMATEYAKSLTWEGRFNALECQQYVWGKQLFALERLRNKVDAIITDSPLLLSLYYGKNENIYFQENVLRMYQSFDNIDFYVTRVKPFNQAGRNQSENEAREIDKFLKGFLPPLGVDLIYVNGDVTGVDMVFNQVKKEIDYRRTLMTDTQ